MTNPSESTHGKPTPEAAGAAVTDGEPVLRSERLRIINEEQGRTAHSPAEINDMYYLSQPRYDHGGALDYIGRIARSNGRYAYQRPLDDYDEMTRNVFHSLTLAHQIKAKFVDPEGKAKAVDAANNAGVKATRHAMMGVTENFLDYLNDAHETIQALDEFDESLGEDDISQDIKFGELDIEVEMAKDESLKRAIGVVTQYVEGFLFSRGVGEDYTKTDYMSDDPAVISREVETVGEINIRFLREIIAMVRTLELGRKNFWTVQLIGQSADEESGTSKRLGVNSINDPELREYLATSLGQIYRGVYKTPIEM